MWEWDGRVRWLAIGLVAAFLFGAGLQYGRWQERQAAKEVPWVVAGDQAAAALTGAEAVAGDGLADDSKPSTIQVHVTGAVQRPGVYELKAGARVNEAVGLAGLLPEADANALNLAAPLYDGQQVIVPRQGEAGGVGGSSLPAAQGFSGGSSAGIAKSGGKININTAGLAELDTLPGIGPTLAQRILDYRQEKGPFRTIEDLQNVSGIGPQKFADLKDLITVY